MYGSLLPTLVRSKCKSMGGDETDILLSFVTLPGSQLDYQIRIPRATKMYGSLRSESELNQVSVHTHKFKNGGLYENVLRYWKGARKDFRKTSTHSWTHVVIIRKKSSSESNKRSTRGRLLLKNPVNEARV